MSATVPARDLAGVTATRQLTDDQQALADAIAAFGEGEAGTHEQREQLTHGGTHLHNAELYKQFAELGFVGAPIAEEYGGMGGGMVELCVLAEEVMYGRLPVEAMMVTHIVAGA